MTQYQTVCGPGGVAADTAGVWQLGKIYAKRQVAGAATPAPLAAKGRNVTSVRRRPVVVTKVRPGAGLRRRVLGDNLCSSVPRKVCSTDLNRWIYRKIC